MPVRVLLVDDEQLIRVAIARLLEQSGEVEVVGLEASGADAVARVRAAPPDLALVDLRMAGLDGVQTTQQILAADPSVRVLILTSYDNDVQVLEAMRAGASGYLLKDSSPEAIVNAIKAVMSGSRVMARAASERVLGRVPSRALSTASDHRLTPREVEILRLVALGVNNKQAARDLKITEKTVRNHISAIYGKLGISDRSQAALHAVRMRLIDV